ncbi:MAG: Acetyl-coenzyme A synthetase [Methanocella sp. PtaU1.Bin125]|nr:MAG: Acetyl-coenzyme A synthetase [Methanocella sp. PtaU1.Bin125]
MVASVSYTCVYDVLFNGGQPEDMMVVRDIGRTPLTLRRLRQHVAETVSRLNAMGFRRNDRLVIVMPQGPEACVLIMSVMAGFAVVPMNPYYSRAEFESYMADLGAKGLIVRAGSDSLAVDAARCLGIRVVEVVPRPDEEAGVFSFAGEHGKAVAPAFAEPDDLGMILFTSGTTAKPKMVPFTQRRIGIALTAYAEKRVRPYDPAACNLGVQPLFHLHGSIFPFLSLCCNVGLAVTPGTSVPLFVKYLQEYRPAWGSMGPALLRDLLNYAEENPSYSLPKGIASFACGGAHLSREQARAFEARLGVPVVNSYGMSEAITIVSNNVEKARAKPGSVGTADYGTEIRFIDEKLEFLPPGEPGEIVLRGPMVVDRYLNNPEENAKAFIDGWFRTGDLGYMDADGYLYITGRIRELINKGGEKVSPGEIEEILCSHPAVSEAVAFPVPDPALGENVGAVVVPKREMAVRPADLKKLVSGKLAYFKVPAKLWIVDSIPRGPTGKVRRIGLYQVLKDAGKLVDTPVSEDYEPPVTPEEEAVTAIWAEVLGLQRVGRHDSFFDLGGNSLNAARLVAQIEKRLKVTAPISLVFTAPTVSLMTKAISNGQADREPRYMVAMQPEGSLPPVYVFPPVHGALNEYYPLVRNLAPDQPVYGFISPGLDGVSKTPETIEATARLYLEEIRRHQPHGPYHLLGYCGGGLTAYEAACQLEAAGEKVGFLGVIDIKAPGDDPDRFLWSRYRLVKDKKDRARFHWEVFRQTDTRGKIRKFARAPGFLARKAGGLTVEAIGTPVSPAPQAASSCIFPPWIESFAEPQRSVSKANTGAIRAYAPKPYGGGMTLFLSSDEVASRRLNGKYELSRGWKKLAKGGVRRHVIDGHHGSIMNPERSKAIAAVIRAEVSRFLAQ